MACRRRRSGEAALKCAIMQPTYLPWAGYFALIAAVDVFILLDDVQFERKSWQSRNRILINGKDKVLEVPVAKQPLTEKISNIRVDSSKDWRNNHAAELDRAYGQTSNASALADVIEIVRGDDQLLSDLNGRIITTLARQVGIETPIVRASSLGCGGRRSEHVAEICRAVGAGSYLSPPGARDYLEADGFAANSGLHLSYLAFDASPYPQAGSSDFVSHLSILDVLANCGREFTHSYVLGKS